jgi:hypothetical protein
MSKLMSSILSFLNRAAPAIAGEVVPVPNFVPEALTPKASAPAPIDQSTARRDLRASQDAYREAKVDLEAAIKITARVRQVVHDADTAAAELKAAEDAYVTAANAWATNGARGDVASSELLVALDMARTRARTSELAAQGARTALQQQTWDDRLERYVRAEMSAQEASAREALRTASERARRAVWPVLMAEVEPDLHRALALHAELVELMPRLRGFQRLCDHNVAFKGSTGDFTTAFNTVTRPLVPSVELDKSEPLRLMAPWEDFGNHLMRDPATTF